jgi:hypothetical protein
LKNVRKYECLANFFEDCPGAEIPVHPFLYRFMAMRRAESWQICGKWRLGSVESCDCM